MAMRGRVAAPQFRKTPLSGHSSTQRALCVPDDFSRSTDGVFPFSNFYFLVGRWLSGRSKLRHGRETAGLKTRHYNGLRQGRRELAGGEGVEGAEAFGQFGGGQAPLAVEPAEKISGGAIP